MATRDTGGSRSDVDAGHVGVEEVERARASALRLIGFRQRTEHELATALAKRGFSPEATDAVVHRFVEVGLLDDGAYALEWARVRHERRGLAARSIRAELLGKGVAPECVEAALVPLVSGEEAVAREVLTRSARRLDQLPAPVRVRRLSAALVRKGYAADLVRRLVREHEQDRGGEAAEVGLG